MWKEEDVLKISAGALFRIGQSWAVFFNQGDPARRREIGVGRRGTFEVEISNGLKAGEEVILHSFNQIEEWRHSDIRRKERPCLVVDRETEE
jgi:HlyD family secretion protein